MRLELFNGESRAGVPALVENTGSTDFAWFGAVAPQIDHSAFAARISCTVTARETGPHLIGLMSAGLSKLYVDDVEVLDAWDSWSKGESYFGHGCDERRGTIHLVAGQIYRFRVEYFCGDGIATSLKAVRFGLRSIAAAGSIEEAVRIANDADAVIVVTGLNAEWETESEDRRSLSLPPGQDDLINAVSAVNPRTIVVTQSGCPLAMPWIDKVAAVLHQWYAGQECGNALADVILGLQEPSGRLPQVFPANDDQIAAVTERPERGGTVAYSEGLVIGQRRFDVLEMTPLFPFGHGLGFGLVHYESASVTSLDDGGLRVEIDLHNKAQRPTLEVVQVYRKTEGGCAKLLAFDKVEIGAESAAAATLIVPHENLREWDPAASCWTEPAKLIHIAIGRSSADIRLELGVSRG